MLSLDRNWNLVMRPNQWSDIVGQSQYVGMFQTMVNTHSFPSFSILGGPPGVGKSLIAELIGKSLTCTGEGQVPCGQCANCKSFDSGKSMRVIKYDMPNIGEDTIEEVITNIFKVDSTGTRVFILEEAHVMNRDRIQTRFLEGTTRIPEDVYIIICTTQPYSLIPALRNRASMFMLETPSDDECIELIRRASERFGFELPSIDIMTHFVKMNRNSPRGILQTLESLALSGSMDDDVLRTFLRMQGTTVFCDVLCALLDNTKSVYDFITVLHEDKEIDCVQIVRGLRDFVLSVLLEVSLGEKQAIPSEERKKVQRFLKEQGDKQLLRITDFLGGINNTDYISNSDAMFKLVSLKLKLLDLTTRKIVSDSREDAAEARMKSISDTVTKTRDMAVRKVISGDSFITSKESLKGHLGGL